MLRRLATAPLLLASLLGGLLLGCASARPVPGAGPGGGPEEPPAAKPMPAEELIPREVLFGNPDHLTPLVSPDGERIAWIAPLEGVLNVYVAPTERPEEARAVTRDRGRGIRIHRWAYDGRHLLYLQDEAGDENWHVHAVDLETGEDRDLTPIGRIQARILALSHLVPDAILVGLNDRDPRLHDVYRIDLSTGERTLVLRNEGWAAFVIDPRFRIRLAMRMTPDGGSEFFRVDPETGEVGDEVFMRVPQEDVLTTDPFGVDAEGRTLFMADSRGRNTAALTAVDLSTGEARVLAEDPLTDLDDVVMHPERRVPQAAAFNRLRRRWQTLDPEIAPDLQRLAAVVDGDLQVLSRSLADRVWTVGYTQDDGPVVYYRYDREAGEARFLFPADEALARARLLRMHPVLIPTRDALEMVAYLTLPEAADPDGDGRPSRPVPMVLLVHGGPWSRDRWGYNPYHQWLANRGYAVLSVNFRGSTGFGKVFVNAGDREWAAKMHDDLLDAVAWAVERGVTTEDRVAIMGGSYGGYATLVGLTFTPEAFACGVDIVGPSNLLTLLESIPPYWEPMLELFATRVGDPRTEEGRALLEERSPLRLAHRIQRPLLIGQGANDPRVKKAESDQIVQAMKEKGIPVTYVVYPDEGHGFVRPENRLSFFAVTEAFLAACLGGAREPIGDDLEGSSIRVEEGTEHVPGLEEALPGGLEG